MTVTVSISGRAEADLTRQYRYYLDEAGLEIGERFLAAFHATFLGWRNSPNWGAEGDSAHQSWPAFDRFRSAVNLVHT